MDWRERRERYDRQTDRIALAVLVIGIVVVVLVVLAGCGSTAGVTVTPKATPSPAPAEFRAACGHPGTVVHVRRVPVTVTRAQCDLRGAVIERDGVRVPVPSRPGGVRGEHLGGGTGGGTLAVLVRANGDVEISQ